MEIWEQAPGSPILFENPLAVNFRELGGYRAGDGRHVRHGLLYRGIALGVLRSDADRAKLEGFGLRTVLDLRSKGEAEMEPDWVPEGARYLRLCGMRQPDGSEMDFSPSGIAEMEEKMAGFVDSRQFLIDLYAGMPFGNPAFLALFDLLRQGEDPILFHCTAGKDRTGIAAILILLALGVDGETAMEDYLLTNRCREPLTKTILEENAEFFASHPAERDQMILRNGVQRELAESALQRILEKYHSYEDYFEAEYGLDAAGLASLRDQYLE